MNTRPTKYLTVEDLPETAACVRAGCPVAATVRDGDGSLSAEIVRLGLRLVPVRGGRSVLIGADDPRTDLEVRAAVEWGQP
jgi:hypothetical protein